MNSSQMNCYRAMDEEMEELRRLALSLAAQVPDLAPELKARVAAFEKSGRINGHPVDAENRAERFARDLRRCWLQYTAVSTSSVYRSPTKDDQEHLAANPQLETFGYERDLRPEILEHRCASFFRPPPAPWRVEHVLFSSGQAALTTALLALQRDFTTPKLTIAHVGAYFETRSLIESQPALFDLADEGDAADADCLIVESIACNGTFSSVDVGGLADQLKAMRTRRRAVIFDSTLMGRADDVNRFLKRTSANAPFTVFRVCSGLKLFQAGLELANVGILSVFESCATPSPIAEHLRRLRTLTGGGLRLADAVALEAPWVFDRELTRIYEDAIFANNAMLAREVARHNALFEPVSHPALQGADAPYCVFRLRKPSDAAYSRVQTWLANQAKSMQVQFDQGGSFGFRGHRFEVVRPETGEAPFLRVAMGRRGGWSCNGVIAMMRDLARRPEMAEERVVPIAPRPPNRPAYAFAR